MRAPGSSSQWQSRFGPPGSGSAPRLVDASGVHLRTAPAQVGSPVLISDASGESGSTRCPTWARVRAGCCCHRTRSRRTADRPRPRRGAAAGDDCVRADRAARGWGRAVVMGHAWVAGGAASESERDISSSGASVRWGRAVRRRRTMWRSGICHAPQTLSETVRYSGSPAGLFVRRGGADQGSWLVELDAKAGVHAECVPARCRGSFRASAAGSRISDRPALSASKIITCRSADRPGRPADPMTRCAAVAHVLVLGARPGGALTIWGVTAPASRP